MIARVLLASALALAGVAQSGIDPVRRIEVRVRDYANVPDWAYGNAMATAMRAFSRIGVELTFAREVDGMALPEAGSWRVSILSAPMVARKCLAEGIASNVVGTSMPAARQAYVFYDRLVPLTLRGAADIDDLLGRVITHELGHLALPGSRHGDGIMRSELGLNRVGYYQFTAAQGEAIRRSLGAVTLARGR